MKYCYLFFCCSCLCLYQGAYAQYRPEYSHFMLNNYLINPAITGIENYTDVQIGYRRQWLGIEGSPQTVYISAHSPLGLVPRGFSNTINRNNEQINRYPRSRERKPIHGIGGMLLSDRIGPFSRFQGYLSYAYHLPITNQFTLSMGASLGAIHNTIDPDRVLLNDPNDPTINNFSREFSLDGAVGIFGYTNNFYAGIAFMDINALSTSGDATISPFSDMQIMLTTGMKIDFTTSPLSLLPSLQVRTIGNDAVSWQSALRLLIKDQFWIGSGYRFESDFILMTGMYINNLLSFSYAYDLGVATPARYSEGSHEFTLGVRLFNEDGIICPQKLW